MKLYFATGACSLSPRITLLESGLEFTAQQVDLRTKITGEGQDFRSINPKGSVPALELANGEILTEGPAIVQYIADQVPRRELAPPAGTIGRYRLQEWLNWTATEVHKAFGPLFRPNTAAEVRDLARAQLETKFDFVDARLRDRTLLLGERFTVAEPYLYVMTRWAVAKSFDLARWPALMAFSTTLGGRPTVQLALTDEGLS